jgi:hypothetical protein
MGFDVFISHSSKDKLTADAVCAVLESRAIRCWVAPRDIQPGADWGEAIVGAIKDCRVMVLVFSQNANTSTQIKREVERAIHHGKTIVPLRIEEILPTGTLEYSLSTTHWLDAFSPPLERRPWWKTPTGMSIGVVAALVLLYVALHMLFPPSIQGKWTLHQAIKAPLNSAFADLISEALSGPNVKGELQIKALNEYSLSITATDSGKVAPATGDDSGSRSLSFLSDSTQKTTTISYYFSDTNNPGAFSAFGVTPGDKILMWGINLGAGTVVVHGNSDSTDASPPFDRALVGTWLGSPFNVNPPNGLWGGTLAIHADGTYLLTVTHEESGVLTISNGTLSAKPSATGMYGMAAPSLFNDPSASATYSLSGNTLQIGTTNGPLSFERGW